MPKSQKRNPSSTKGIAKGWNCKKTVLKTRMAKDERFYKTGPVGDYEKALMEVGQLKGNINYPYNDNVARRNSETLQDGT